jgi:hypothetical protein
MKKILLLLAMSFLIGTPSIAQSVPVCAVNGDMDSDGVLDDVDSDETDSCLATSSGHEDCTTGAGDGVADCSN